MVDYLKNLPPELAVLIVSFLPIFELRGAIPLGVLYYNLPLWKTLILSLVGNLLPVPILLILLRPLSNLASRWGITKMIFDILFGIARRKGVSVSRLKILGLYLFVALPVPGTGAWMGTVIAEVFNVGFFPALVSICLGVVTAGFVVAFVSKFGILFVLAFFTLLFILSYFLSKE